MVRWLAIVALLSLVSGCTIKVSNGAQPNYDYTDYQVYDQPHGVSPR